MPRITTSGPDPLAVGREWAVEGKRALRQASVYAVDKVTRDAATEIKAEMRSAGLGRLAGAVGQSSTARRKAGDDGSSTPFGVIFNRSGDQSITGGALQAYSQGALIRAQNGQWLAFQTNAIPRRSGRFRMTPARYNASGLVSSIGKLVFRPISATTALLVVNKVTVNAKGRARRAGPRARLPVQKEVVAFILIRQTARAKRFDPDAAIERQLQKLDPIISQRLRTILSSGVTG